MPSLKVDTESGSCLHLAVYFYGDFWQSDLMKEGRREGEGGREEGGRGRKGGEREGGKEGLEHVWRGGGVRNCCVMGVCVRGRR